MTECMQAGRIRVKTNALECMHTRSILDREDTRTVVSAMVLSVDLASFSVLYQYI